MKSIEHLFCKSLMEMVPYSPIEPPDQIAKRLGLDEQQIIKLDANENPYGTSPEIMSALANVQYYHIYPDPAQVQLREAIAEYAGFQPENIIAGTGADEIIDIVCRLLLEPNDEVLSFVPTFSYYAHVIALNKGRYLEIPRESDFSISLETVNQLDLSRCKLVILCSPNNPSGNLLPGEVLQYFLQKDLIVMLDEAYYEFSSRTFASEILNHGNLIVLRTFSKCFAMAGLRVGYGIGATKLISTLMKIKPPFSVNIAAEVALKTCLNNLPSYSQQVEEIKKTREWSLQQLRRFDQLQVYPSESNFILCRLKNADAAQLTRQLERSGILIRYFATDRLKDCIRISVGTLEQMRTLVERLGEILS